MNKEEYITIQAATIQMGIDEQVVRNLIKQGEISCLNIADQDQVFLKDVVAYKAKMTDGQVVNKLSSLVTVAGYGEQNEYPTMTR